ncbi:MULTISPECIES: hypothetical protein [unclassified Streptomyces]|nr:MULTISPECIES: hypothetical protein [unclassified Streptomyces]MCX5442425.1 hypothetical protein [Streptomyces sp. NBC_00063]WUB91369.1 hypothetical protein OHO83_02990 [Streptomyces sp. NBC_00569]
MFELEQGVVPPFALWARDRPHGLQLRVLRQFIGHGCTSMPGAVRRGL